jgi:hypothetical protein
MTGEALEVPPQIPPDWRDWINKVPTVKTIAVSCIGFWLTTPVGMITAAWLIGSGRVTGAIAVDGVLRMVDLWLNALIWVTAAAVLGVVGKFATTKPDVIRAEAEAHAKAVVAQATAAAIAPAGSVPSPQRPATPADGE